MELGRLFEEAMLRDGGKESRRALTREEKVLLARTLVPPELLTLAEKAPDIIVACSPSHQVFDQHHVAGPVIARTMAALIRNQARDRSRALRDTLPHTSRSYRQQQRSVARLFDGSDLVPTLGRLVDLILLEYEMVTLLTLRRLRRVARLAPPGTRTAVTREPTKRALADAAHWLSVGAPNLTWAQRARILRGLGWSTGAGTLQDQGTRLRLLHATYFPPPRKAKVYRKRRLR